MFQRIFLKLFQVKNWSANETGTPVSGLVVASPVFLVHFAAGKISSFHIGGDVSAGVANLCRGVASVFQYQSDAGEGIESDVTGDCLARYITGAMGELLKIDDL